MCFVFFQGGVGKVIQNDLFVFILFVTSAPIACYLPEMDTLLAMFGDTLASEN